VAKSFYDTKVLLYLVSAETTKADRAEAVLAKGGFISVQVLNEFAAVATRKLDMAWSEVGEILTTVRQVCPVESVTVQTHDRAREIAAKYGYGFYDALIIAAALLAGCSLLYSEDMQTGQRIEGRLTIKNPFKS
jgi:predicted nucleic acid-binding protein